ncbi:MAG: amidohydrolase family protein [Spirochaetales bacterium]|nr:amidohydrolase family protein [Spirochaetales bacterium]
MRTDDTVQAYSLEGAVLVTPRKTLKKALRISGRKIEALGKPNPAHFSFKDSYVFPALINVHDHLRGDYLPKVGPPPGTFYVRCHDWEKDLRAAKLVAVERAKISEKDCYLLGAYKNLFAGAATVNDHFLHSVNDQYIPFLPIRVVSRYTLHHEPTSYSLPWGEGIEIEHQRARNLDLPFIIHMEEGMDAEYQRGLDLVEELDCLDDHNVHVHCVGYSDLDIAKTKKAGAHVVWCPNSNIFMYNLTCKIRKILAAGINVSLGTDSTATGSLNLLEELRFARRTYRKLYGEEISARLLTDMVTENAAAALRVSRDIGSLEEGKLADAVVLARKDDDPYESLVKTNIEDIELLVLEGDPIFGRKEHEEIFALRGQKYATVKLRGREMLVKGDPAGLMRRVREAVGFKKVLDFIPLDL